MSQSQRSDGQLSLRMNATLRESVFFVQHVSSLKMSFQSDGSTTLIKHLHWKRSEMIIGKNKNKPHGLTGLLKYPSSPLCLTTISQAFHIFTFHLASVFYSHLSPCRTQATETQCLCASDYHLFLITILMPLTSFVSQASSETFILRGSGGAEQSIPANTPTWSPAKHRAWYDNITKRRWSQIILNVLAHRGGYNKTWTWQI